jgi:GalNAc-alpha-(1->4)-GalNAc-alpha-(1->3)-diNAcBac-PP-undecaprenol alpha-1,4-N-acetyl-D-galactosaminyltransferase
MKILFVCDTMGSGGAERVISTLSNEFVARENDVTIVMLSSVASEPFYKLDNQIELIHLAEHQKKLGFLKKARLLKKVILGCHPDIVISFLSYVCIYTWQALKRTNIPYITCERNDPNQRNRIKQFFLNLSFKKASGSVFQTEDALKWYSKVARKNVVVIHNPVNLTSSPNDKKNIKNQILFVGRLTDQKNCFMLFEAFEIFVRKHNDFTLKLYGGGELETNLKALASQKGLNEKVLFLSPSKTWHKDEFNSRLFVLPSKYEGMPNVLSEALCLGIPSVSTDCTIGGPKELKMIFPDLLILSKKIDAFSFAQAMEEALNINPQKPSIPNELEAEHITSKWLEFIKQIVK